MAGFIELTAPNGKKWTQPTGLFINNEFVKSVSSKPQTITSYDPATEKEIATVVAGSAEDVDVAVEAAKKALKSPEWKNITATERGQIMTKFAELLEERRELFATIDAWDNGKPYSVAYEEDTAEAVLTIRYYAGWADKLHGQTFDTHPKKFAYSLRQPIGVCAQIIPWNYPLSMAAWKLGPALACGNTVVLKPAEQTPLSALILAQTAKDAGFPPGVLNVVNGLGREAGAALVQHPKVDKVAFTGSTATASSIMKMAAGTLKNITLETGGKSPLLVFPDADIEQAIKWSHFGIMANQGQVCTATSRILVHADIYDEFVPKFLAQVKEVSVVGNQWDEKTFQGPQVTKAQYDRILSYMDTGVAEGAKLLAGGRDQVDEKATGHFVVPTVFGEVKPDMRIYQEEVFGPFAVIVKFKTEEEAIELANNTVYGLGSAVFTRDIERAHRVAAEIEAGMVWINSSQDCDPRVPFGGVKQSGIGRELGEAGLAGYSQIKAVHVNMGTKL